MYSDIESVNQEVEIFVELARQYRFKRDDIFVLKQMSHQTYVETQMAIKQLLTENPSEVVLIF